MVQKRPFTGESYEVSFKHPRQFEHSGQLVSFLEFPSEDVGRKSHFSGKDCFSRTISEHFEEPESGNFTELPEDNTGNNSPGRVSDSSWSISCTSEEDVSLEAPFHTLVSPKYCESDRPTRAPVHTEDTYTFLLEQPPQKFVSIGPDFQADVPEWCPHGAKDISVYSDSAEAVNLCRHSSGSNLNDHFNVENKFTGTCVIPMPKEESHACNGDGIGECRIYCFCELPGSSRCVRQHIVEARQNLEREIGQGRFVDLGFCDMGEVVAEKWSDEDEQLFQEVVFSNPSSGGKNFWDCLSAVFPSRTKKEIVSYYFNVFMLRRRVEQNRFDSLNIDSDDDEGQESNDEFEISGEDTFSEEDEEPVVEFPVFQGISAWSGKYDDCSHELASGIDTAVSHHYNVDFAGGNERITIVSETRPEKLLNSCGADVMFCPSERTLFDETGDYGISDHSSASSDTGIKPEASQLKVDNSKCFSSPFNKVSGEGGHEFFLEPCDAKVWDVGYLTCPRNDVEFLPTSSMIEEVFGVGSWNY